MAKTKNLTKDKKGINESKTEKKQNKVVISITQVFRNLSISVNLTVYAIYLLYLIYSIFADIGIKVINIVLAMVTAAFMVVYLVLRLSTKRKGKQLKAIKHYYKNFKLVARTVSAITAVYALLAAVSSVSPLAIIMSFLGAVFLVLRLIVELVLSLIRRKVRKVKDSITDRFRKPDADDVTDEDDGDGEEEEPKRKPRRRGRKVPKYRRTDESKETENIIIPVDQCLLNDIDE